MVHEIIRFPATSLRSTCKDIDFSCVDKDALVEHLQDLKDTLAVTPNGIALASNQILPSGYSIFVVRPGTKLPEEIINPKWEPISIAPPEDGPFHIGKYDVEGCLSIPELTIKIRRYSGITLTYFDRDGNKHVDAFTGLESRIIQHECDHLQGKLIYDYAPKEIQVKVRMEAIRNRKAGR